MLAHVNPDRLRLAPAFAVIRDAVLDAWAVVQPIECLGCGAPDRAICGVCRAALTVPWPMRVRCDADPGAVVTAAADYDGVVRSALLSLKDDGRTDAARALAGLLRSALGTALAREPPGIEVAWVPSRPDALRRRGFDPVLEMLIAARIPVSRVLAARWGTRAQKSLGRSDRIASAGRFRARRRLDGRRFVLVDDVVTTGATLTASTASIRAAGGEVVAVVALCAPDRERRAIRADS